MRKFKRGDRVKVTNQHSEFRNMLGTVHGYDRSGSKPLVKVKIDDHARYPSDLKLFPESSLGPTTMDELRVPFVPDS